MRRTISIAAVLAPTFFLFLPTIRYCLVYDDFEQIVTNPRITAWSYLPGYFTSHLWAHSPLQDANFYRPVFLIWLRLAYVLFGAPSAVWHLGSILAHLGATAIVFLLIRRLTDDLKCSALSAAVFGIHPIHAEAVGWISSVEDPLVTIFLVASIYFYSKRRSPISYVSLLFAVLAMFTKEVGIVAPVLIFAYESTQSRLKDAALGAIPYCFGAMLYMALRIHAIGHFFPAAPPSMSVGAMVLTWPRVLALYAGHLVWPVHLSPCYDVPVETEIWPLLLLLVVIAGLVWVLRGASPDIRFGAAWFSVTLLPSLGIRYLLEGDFAHDRYLYLPSVGLALIATALIARLRFTTTRIVAVAVVATALCWATISNLHVWRDNFSLFQRAVETAPKNISMKNNLAAAYLDLNREAEAFPLLQQVLAAEPGSRLGNYNLGRYYQQSGDEAAADRYFSIADQIYNHEQAGRVRADHRGQALRWRKFIEQRAPCPRRSP
ncbi:MAG: hypothetical protein LAN37_14165 [Acidobacteriia bacterium]|nr:hypothetical protein [Terriglobia bacterium]